MIVLRDPKQLDSSPESTATAVILKILTDVLQACFNGMSDGDFYDPDEHGYIVIAEPGDEATLLEAETGYPILSDWLHGCQYGDDDFCPAFEWLEEHPCCYELCFIPNDSGFVLLLVVPKMMGIDAQLLAMCRENV
jgi:hypothetical protein